MANLAFATKTFTATDWDSPNSNGVLYLAGNPVVTMTFPKNLDDNFIIGVQAYSVGPMVQYTGTAPHLQLAGQLINKMGWGISSPAKSNKNLTFTPFLQLGGPSHKIDLRTAYLRLSIIVQYQ